MRKTEVLWEHGVIGHFYQGSRDIGPGVWRRHFGEKHVPACTCKHRQIEHNGHVDLPVPRNMPGFRLHYGPDSAIAYGELRSRLSVLLYRETQDAFVIDAELESLAPMAGRTAKSVLSRLRRFELAR